MADATASPAPDDEVVVEAHTVPGGSPRFSWLTRIATSVRDAAVSVGHWVVDAATGAWGWIAKTATSFGKWAWGWISKTPKSVLTILSWPLRLASAALGNISAAGVLTVGALCVGGIWLLNKYDQNIHQRLVNYTESNKKKDEAKDTTDPAKTVRDEGTQVMQDGNAVLKDGEAAVVKNKGGAPVVTKVPDEQEIAPPAHKEPEKATVEVKTSTGKKRMVRPFSSLVVPDLATDRTVTLADYGVENEQELLGLVADKKKMEVLLTGVDELKRVQLIRGALNMLTEAQEEVELISYWAGRDDASATFFTSRLEFLEDDPDDPEETAREWRAREMKRRTEELLRDRRKGVVDLWWFRTNPFREGWMAEAKVIVEQHSPLAAAAEETETADTSAMASV